jgi:hypothetical protein
LHAVSFLGGFQTPAALERPARIHTASRNNNEPAFEVIAPPSNAAVAFRPPTLAKSRESWLHSVGIGARSCVRKILCGKRTFADSARRCAYPDFADSIDYDKLTL